MPSAPLPALSRRSFFARTALAAPALAATGLTLAARPALAEPVGAVTPLAQIAIGRFTVTFLTDGYADIPYAVFTGQSPEAVEAAARAQFRDRDGAIRIGFTQYLIDDGDRLVLVDAGPAGLIGETGRFPSALAAAGVAPEDIDAVIFTHTHMDHIGGAVADGRRVFPNAEVYVDRRDIAYFGDSGRRAGAPELLHSSFDTTAELLRLYPNLQQTEGDHAIASGLEIVDLTGHTPGHVGVRISDAGESLMLVSDMMFSPVVHPSSAAHGFAFEQDPAAAEAMRAAFFPAAAAEGTLIAATHMPFPGLGRIVRDGGALRWLPAEWAHAG